MEGFLNLKWSRFKRVLLTRSLAIIPTFAIAFYSDINDLTHMNDILNVLQSILLPFALIPILHFCALPSVMGEFRTGRFWTIAGPVVAIGIIGINLFFTYSIIIEYESVAVYVVTAVLAVLYFVGFLILHSTEERETRSVVKSLKNTFCFPHPGIPVGMLIRNRSNIKPLKSLCCIFDLALFPRCSLSTTPRILLSPRRRRGRSN